MDKDEAAKLILEAEPTLYHISKSILKNDFDCADAVQETVMKAFDKLATLREERYFKTWLCSILIRECYSIGKLRKRTVSFEEHMETEQAFESDEIGLYNAVMQLKMKHRLVVILHYVEGFRTSEIARMLKIPEGTVKSRLSHARSELKLLLDEKEENDDEVGQYFSGSSREFS